jgi:CRP/FNR family transcriptional regulator, cyclic AMP receptor protein
MSTIYETIAKTPVFEGLDPTHLKFIAAGAEEVTVPAGTLVLMRGEAAERFFVISEGTIALEIASPGHGAVRVLTLHEPELVGWSWLFDPYRWQVDGRAVTDCRLIAIDAPGLREQCNLDPRFGFEIASRLGSDVLVRTGDSWQQILNLTVRDA